MINNKVGLKFYYRTDNYCPDYYDKKDMTKNCTELTDFSQLKPILDKIYQEYTKQSKPDTSLDIIVFIEDARQYLQSCPLVGVRSAMQDILEKKKRFIKKKNQKTDCFHICADFETETSTNLYHTIITDIQEVERILYDYVINHIPPNISGWKCDIIKF